MIRLRVLVLAGIIGGICVAAGCGEQRVRQFGMRYDVFHGVPLLERGVELRWGTSSVLSVGGAVSLEQWFARRDEALNYGEPVTVLVAGETISSETVDFDACNFVTRTGLDPGLIRMARFWRVVEPDGTTVMPGSRSTDPALLCYTMPTVVEEKPPSSRELAAIVRLSLPLAPLQFSVSGRLVVPAAVGKNEDSSGITALLRLSAPPGAKSFGHLAVTTWTETSQPIEISADWCSWGVDPSKRLIEMRVTLRSDGGALSVDPSAPLSCCYDDGSCSTTIA